MKEPTYLGPDDSSAENLSEEERKLQARLERELETFEQENEAYAEMLEGKSRDEIAKLIAKIRVIDSFNENLRSSKDEKERKIIMKEINRTLVSMDLSEKYVIFEGE